MRRFGSGVALNKHLGGTLTIMRFDFAKFAFIASSSVLIYMTGFAAGAFRWFPFDVLIGAQRDLKVVGQDLGTALGLKPTHFVNPARHNGTGLTRRDPERSALGLTLITSYFDEGTAIRLIDEDGIVVREWQPRFSQLFPDGNLIGKRPRTDWNTDIHGALIEPDGSIIFNFEWFATVKLDRCGSTVWTLPKYSHHSISRASDGSYWIPGLAVYEEQTPWPLVQPPATDHTLMKISPDGRVLLEKSLTEIIFDNHLHALLFSDGDDQVSTTGEIVHLNDIEELTIEMAGAYPSFETGDLLISIRDHNMLLVINPVDFRVKWSQVGPWMRQHDPDFQSDGTITVFNNNSDGTVDGARLGGSNIVRIDPDSRTWQVIFGTTPAQRFFTNIRGKHQILPNGNLLLTEFAAGRAIESTPEGDMVWEYVNRYDEDEVLEITEASRYPREYFTVADWSCPDDSSALGKE
jgi:Arylsulfotransferase (ASST)